jgi:lysophospholipase L1-like esterase
MPTGGNPIVGTPLTYLALGDSYTAGTAVKPEERWANLLAVKLRQESFNVNPPDLIAQSGMVTADLIATIKNKNPANNYDMVSLLIGVNNQFRGQTTDVYQREFKELLLVATNLAKGRPERVFVLSLPDWGQTPWAAFSDRPKISREIDALNLIAKEECALQKISFIDITALSRLAINDRTLVSGDDLHYSEKMYFQWAEKALPVVKELLKK